jgi:hypothetical protein
MSSQWETAKHCHISLSVLAAKIKQPENSSDSTAKSQAYATRETDGSPTIGETLNTREESRRRLSGLSTVPEDHFSLAEGSHDHQGNHEAVPNIDSSWKDQDNIWTQSTQLPNRNEYGALAETPSSLQMEFQNTDAAHFEGISNFDLNMVDLIQGANFDTLFDLIGQQYPSF